MNKENKACRRRAINLARGFCDWSAGSSIDLLCEWLLEPSSAFPFLASLYVEVTPNGRWLDVMSYSWLGRGKGEKSCELVSMHSVGLSVWRWEGRAGGGLMAREPGWRSKCFGCPCKEQQVTRLQPRNGHPMSQYPLTCFHHGSDVSSIKFSLI